MALGGDALAAHAHADPATGRLVTFSHRVRLGLRGPVTRLTVYEFDQVGMPGLLRSRRVPRERNAMRIRVVGCQAPLEAPRGAGKYVCRCRKPGQAATSHPLG